MEQRMTKVPREKTAQRMIFLERESLARMRSGSGMAMIMMSVETLKARVIITWFV
jgi:hypothetical protein